MYLAELHIKGFRGIADLRVALHEGLNVLIGENNTCKTAVLDALRIVLGQGQERRDLYLSREDFYTSMDGTVASTAEIHATFRGLTAAEQGIFIEMLALDAAGGTELQMHLRLNYDEGTDRVIRECWGGEHEGQSIPVRVLELLYFVYLSAFRDASRELQPNRGNRLSQLFTKLIPTAAEQRPFESEMATTVRAMPQWKNLLQRGKEKINEHLGKVALQNTPRAVNLDFVHATFRRITEGIKMSVPHSLGQPPPSGQGEPPVPYLAISQNGLGANNLVYIATVLGDLLERRAREPDSYISLLIEEPEAHLHPQLQNILFRYLQEIENKGVQVLVSSHSPTITAKTHIDSLIVLTKSDGVVSSTPLRDLQLPEENKRHLERFLDVTKSQLFFANAVILVEGISEALLLPVLAQQLGEKYNLERKGVEIVNINGVAFEPFTRLFNSTETGKRLNIRCALVTDDDRDLSEGGEVSARAVKAKELATAMAQPFLATCTFEYELFLLNEPILLEVYRQLHPRTSMTFAGTTMEERGKVFLQLLRANRDKGVFAQNLAQHVQANPGVAFHVPPYIKSALDWATGNDAKGADTATA